MVEDFNTQTCIWAGVVQLARTFPCQGKGRRFESGHPLIVNSNIMSYYFTYVLFSFKDNNFYTGFTSDLKKRIKEHKAGEVYSTKNRLPVELIYFEVCLNKYDAIHREKYLKTGHGKRFLKNRMKYFLKDFKSKDKYKNKLKEKIQSRPKLN